MQIKYKVPHLPEEEGLIAVKNREIDAHYKAELEKTTDPGKLLDIKNDMLSYYIRSDQLYKALPLADELMNSGGIDEAFRDSLWVRLGVIAEKKHNYELAESCYRSALDSAGLDEDYHYWACNNLGFSLNQLNRPQEAETYLKMAIEIDPERSNGFKNLGLSKLQQGEFVLAVENFITATKNNASDDRALLHLEDLLRSHPELYAQIPELEDTMGILRGAAIYALEHQPDVMEHWQKLRDAQEQGE